MTHGQRMKSHFFLPSPMQICCQADTSPPSAETACRIFVPKQFLTEYIEKLTAVPNFDFKPVYHKIQQIVPVFEKDISCQTLFDLIKGQALSADHMLSRIKSDVASHTEGAVPSDDITLLAVRKTLAGDKEDI